MNAMTSLDESHVMSTYVRQPIALSHGEGAWVWDSEGKRYLDALSGIAVNTLGHRHPRLVAALTDQLNKLIHSSNLYAMPMQEELAAKLAALSGMDKVFFCNSGLEANEAAIKLARLYGHNQGIAVPEIIVYDKAFHGRSMATLSATGNVKVQKGFEPLVPGFVRVPLNDLDAMTHQAEHNPNIVAVFLEAIQGEGGINPAHVEYLQAVRKLCDDKGWLLMIDEVQCGMGRTGKWFAHQWAEIQPDVMPLAKGLGSGVPIGAVVTRGVAAETFKPGNHGTTFGGNQLAMRAALETLAVIEQDHLLTHVTDVGAHLFSRLRDALGQHAGVREIRGKGLMIGIELHKPCAELVAQARDQGVLLNVTADSVIRLLPPLIFSRQQADLLVDTLVPLVLKFLDQ